jgi:hypothetical protein
MRCTVFLALLSAIVVGVRARFVIEEGALKVVLPPEAKSQYPNGFDVALANFGERASGWQRAGVVGGG